MEIDIMWVLVYCAIAFFSIPLVRLLGPVSIVEYRLEESYDRQNAPLNVMYRILSPMLCCSIPMLFCVAVFDFLGLSIPSYRWLPTLWYWIILIAAKAIAGKSPNALFAAFLEALISTILAIACDAFVVEGYAQIGFAVFDQSSLAFQMEVALFYVAVQAIVSLSIRRQYKLACKKDISNENVGRFCYSSGGVDVSEKKLFSYEREYGDLLPSRFKNDPLLRSVFFAIMAIEDSNRPAGVRLLERLVFPTGLSKTTGIMQQQSDKPLSDEESVLFATGYIEGMWNQFLAKYAKSLSTKNDGECITFAANWYNYDYAEVGNALCGSFASLYGDYCGTRLHNAGWVMQNVKKFEERNSYELMPVRVIAQGALFPVESSWISSELAYWDNGQIVRGCSQVPDKYRECYELTATGDCATADFISAAASYLLNEGYWVDWALLAPSAVCKIGCYGKGDAGRPSIDGWRVTIGQ